MTRGGGVVRSGAISAVTNVKTDVKLAADIKTQQNMRVARRLNTL